MVRAWMAAWEMECCGTPFRVGDTVTWPLLDLDTEGLAFVQERLGEDAGAPITHSTIFHGKRVVDIPKTSGVVTGIHALYNRFERTFAREIRPVPHSGRLVWLHDSDAHDDITADDDEGFTAYVVDLDVQEQKRNEEVRRSSWRLELRILLDPNWR